jgi:cold shock CspA family protein
MGGPGVKTGTVKKFFQDKTFGFITMDDGSGDVFAPARTFKGDERDIREGLKVSVETGMDDRSGKLRATTWSELRDGGSGGGMMGGSMPPHGGYGAMPMPHPGADPRFSPYGAMHQPHPGYGAPHPGYGMPALPPGWEQVMDPASGRPYFCNRATGQTSWTPPGGPAPAPAPMPGAAPSAGGLPPGWEQITDPGSGKPYFCNRSTGETSWTPPAMPAAAPAPAPVPAAAPAPGGLPHGWETAQDPSSGKTYFFNRTTNETRWDPPRA